MWPPAARPREPVLFGYERTKHTTRVVVLFTLALAIGLMIGLVRGGTINALRRVHVARPRLGLAVPLALATAYLVPGLLVPGWIVATALFALFAAVNSRLPGLSLVLAGMALNMVVITANGRMPVSIYQAERIGIDATDIESSRVVEPANSDTLLAPVGDVIPFPFPGARSVVSIGDILLASGAGLFGATAPVRALRTLEARRRAGGGEGRARAAGHRAARPGGRGRRPDGRGRRQTSRARDGDPTNMSSAERHG
jgi:hypothetical protein